MKNMTGFGIKDCLERLVDDGNALEHIIKSGVLHI